MQNSFDADGEQVISGSTGYLNSKKLRTAIQVSRQPLGVLPGKLWSCRYNVPASNI